MVCFSFVQLLITVAVIATLLLISLSHCDAYSTTRGLKINAAAGSSRVAGEEKTITSDDDDERVGGRKFMLKWRQLMTRRKVYKKAEEISKAGDGDGDGDGDEDGESTNASKNYSSSGASSVGNSSNHTLMKREMKMEKEKLSSTSVNHHHTKINPSGFMALNADYHMARPHPPKNN